MDVCFVCAANIAALSQVPQQWKGGTARTRGHRGGDRNKQELQAVAWSILMHGHRVGKKGQSSISNSTTAGDTGLTGR